MNTEQSPLSNYRLLTEYSYVQQLPEATKRGLCVFIQALVLVAFVLRQVLEVLQGRGVWPWRRRLSKDATRKVMEELASYVLYETTKQFYSYGPEGQRIGYVEEVLNTVCNCFRESYGIPVESKLQEYNKSENPLLSLGQDIGRAVGDKDLGKLVDVSIEVTSQFETLIDGVERMRILSDGEMTELILDFFENTWPHVIIPVTE